VLNLVNLKETSNCIM